MRPTRWAIRNRKRSCIRRSKSSLRPPLRATLCGAEGATAPESAHARHTACTITRQAKGTSSASPLIRRLAPPRPLLRALVSIISGVGWLGGATTFAPLAKLCKLIRPITVGLGQFVVRRASPDPYHDLSHRHLVRSLSGPAASAGRAPSRHGFASCSRSTNNAKANLTTACLMREKSGCGMRCVFVSNHFRTVPAEFRVGDTARI